MANVSPRGAPKIDPPTVVNEPKQSRTHASTRRPSPVKADVAASGFCIPLVKRT
jgi:hypothetical protein